MRERLTSTLRVCSSSTDINNIPPEKKDLGAAETVSWTDDEVELLLVVVRSFFPKRSTKG